ncbi:MAG TPA: hypothetical protein PKW95_18595 [bacterium]|nr:hypothetical protein [bacterium]
MDFAQNFERNLTAMQARWPSTAALLAQWRDRFDLTLDEAQGGGYVLAVESEQGLSAVSEPVDPASKAAAWAQREIPGGPEYDPLLIAGVRAGYELAALTSLLHRASGGRWQALYVVEPSPELFKAMLHIQDLTELIASAHFYCFVGPEAVTRFKQFLADDPFKPLPKKVSVLSAAATAQDAAQAVSQVVKQRAETAVRLKRRIDQYYDRRSIAQWVEELNGPLRVLQISSGFSHFVRYANRDIAQALTELGHETRIIGERERVDFLTGPALLAAIDEFKPHVIHHIDHMRFESAQVYPTRVIFLTSMLDFFPSLENKEAAQLLGDWDFVTGYVSHWTRFGYRADRLLPQQPMTNEHIFRPVELTAEQIKRFGCEVAYISNISKTPEQYFAETLSQLDDPADRRIAEKFYARVDGDFRAGKIYYFEADYRRALTDVGGDALPAATAERLVHAFLAEVGNALFRQLPLLALSEAGVDLALWGRGWEWHPQLARHARGILEHGEETNLAFNAATINLHINQFQIRHNRLTDGYAAGAFFLVHRHTDNIEYELADVMFAGGARLVEQTQRYLAEPAARQANAQANRKIALALYSYRAQYERSLRQMRYYFDSFTLAEVLAQIERSLAKIEEPVGERLASQSLAETIRETTGVDLRPVYDLHFTPEDNLLTERSIARSCFEMQLIESINRADRQQVQTRSERGDNIIAAKFLRSHLFLRSDDEMSRRHYHKLTGERRPYLRKGETFTLDKIQAPFGACWAPDGRIATTDWAGVKSTEERGIWLIDPATGAQELFATGRGVQIGSFGPDGAFYVQLRDEGGVFRITPHSRELILPTGEGTDLEVVPQVVVLPDGRLLLHDHEKTCYRLFDSADGRLREAMPAGAHKMISGGIINNNYLYYLGDYKIQQMELSPPYSTKAFPEPPTGVCASFALDSYGIVGLIAKERKVSPTNYERFPIGLLSMDFSGAVQFIVYTELFRNTPAFFLMREDKDRRALFGVSTQEKLLVRFSTLICQGKSPTVPY